MWLVSQQGEIADEVPSFQRSEAPWGPHNLCGEREQSSFGFSNIFVHSGPRLEPSDPRDPIELPNPYIDCLAASSALKLVPDIISCGAYGCTSSFRGEYRKGNFERHRRMKHRSNESIYACASPSCKTVFRRKDARLKHYRKHHSDLASDPPRARPRKPYTRLSP